MERTARTMAEGAAAGALATGAMTAFMRGAQKTGALGKLPPRIITENALDAAGVERTREEEQALGMVNHFLFGAGAGVLYALLSRRFSEHPTLVGGTLFGSAVWLVSYWGWVPALGIMPPPPKDRPGRPTAMVIAHWVFGASLAAVLRRLR